MQIIKLGLMVLLLTGSLLAQSNDKPRVFVIESQSWEITGGLGGSDDGFGGDIMGGARPQTAEIIKTFNRRCPDCIITLKKERADYIVILEHEGGKDLVRRDNKFALFNRDGDAIASGSTRSLGNAVKDACAVLMKDWAAYGRRDKQPDPDPEEQP